MNSTLEKNYLVLLENEKIYIYIYIYILFIYFLFYFISFFCGLPVEHMKKKKTSEKKKKFCSEGSWMGYCPFSCVKSRYNGVYRDTRPGGAAQRVAGVWGTRHDRVGLGHDTVGPCVRGWGGGGGGGGGGCACGLTSGVSRYKILYHG